jgi:hypothetical protein
MLNNQACRSNFFIIWNVVLSIACCLLFSNFVANHLTAYTWIHILKFWNVVKWHGSVLIWPLICTMISSRYTVHNLCFMISPHLKCRLGVVFCDAPGFWISIFTAKDRLTLVKPRSTWAITLKTKPTTPIDPLDQDNTPLWSNFGQRRGQTPLKPCCRWTSSGTFAAFSKHFKIYQYESCPVFRGTQLSWRLAFPILRRKRWKTWSTTSSSCLPKQSDIQSLAAKCAKSVEKNTIEPL